LKHSSLFAAQAKRIWEGIFFASKWDSNVYAVSNTFMHKAGGSAKGI